MSTPSLCSHQVIDTVNMTITGCDNPAKTRVLLCGNGFTELCDEHTDSRYRDMTDEDYRWIYDRMFGTLHDGPPQSIPPELGELKGNPCDESSNR